MSNRPKPMSESDFAAKIEREGGITDALDYGLKAEDCEPGPLRDAWEKLELLKQRAALIELKWASIEEAIDDVQEILDGYQQEE